MSETTAKPIPVVPGHPVFGSTIDFQKGQLDWILEGHERFGDVFSARILWRDWHFVRDPGVVHAVSVTEASKFHKSSIAKRMWKQFLGNGLVMNDGDSWKRQHKLIMPGFQKRRLDAYAEDMVAYTKRMLLAWAGRERIDVQEEMTALTLAVACKTLFDAEVDGDSKMIGEAMEDASHAMVEHVNKPIPRSALVAVEHEPQKGSRD